MQRYHSALARERSLSGNHLVSRIMVAGETPPSTKPSTKRMTRSWVRFCTRAVAIEQRPQTIRDDGDETLGAPFLGEQAAGDLEEQVAEEEDAAGDAGCGGTDLQVLLHAEEPERDVVPVHEGDCVHQEGGGDDTHPSLLWNRQGGHVLVPRYSAAALL